MVEVNKFVLFRGKSFFFPPVAFRMLVSHCNWKLNECCWALPPPLFPRFTPLYLPISWPLTHLDRAQWRHRWDVNEALTASWVRFNFLRFPERKRDGASFMDCYFSKFSLFFFPEDFSRFFFSFDRFVIAALSLTGSACSPIRVIIIEIFTVFSSFIKFSRIVCLKQVGLSKNFYRLILPEEIRIFHY